MIIEIKDLPNGQSIDKIDIHIDFQKGVSTVLLNRTENTDLKEEPKVLLNKTENTDLKEVPKEMFDEMF